MSTPSPTLIELLRSRLSAPRFDRYVRAVPGTSPQDDVFCNRTGGALDTSPTRRRYKAARQKAGLHEVKLHGLRHAAGSIIARGAGLLVARDALGHAHISTTNRDIQGKADARAIAVINAAYGVPAPATKADEVAAEPPRSQARAADERAADTVAP